MKSRISAAQKHKLMTQLLRTGQGRKRIAASVQEPLRKLRDYLSVGRRMVMVDELPDGTLPIYDADVDIPCYVVAEEGDSIQTQIKVSRLMIPCYEIATLPKIQFTQVKERRYDVVSRIKKKAKDEMFRKEDNKIFSLATVAGLNNTTNTPIKIAAKDYDMSTITLAFSKIERHGLRVDKLFMNPNEFRVFRDAGRDYVDFETQREILKTGFLGSIYGAQIYQSVEIPVGKFFVVTEPEYLGVLPVRIDLTVIPADDPAARSFGWSVFENIGTGLHNADLGLQLIEIEY